MLKAMKKGFGTVVGLYLGMVVVKTINSAAIRTSTTNTEETDKEESDPEEATTE